MAFAKSVSGQSFPTEKKDTTIILLSDMQIQVEATQGLNDMYNFNFRRAEGQFRWLRNKYGWHPLPFLLLGMNEWWKIVPDISNKQYDEKFLAYMDTVIMKAERLYEYPQHRVEAAFFLSAAYGFMGRLYSEVERKNWTKATFVGKNALKYLEESKGKNDLSPELLFGDGLYNYFAEWIPENYALLKPVMLMFPKGDQELGLKQLREVSFNAFYTRTEAMIWLMRIYHNYENNNKDAFYIAEYLYETYPGNAYFQRYYARLLYSTGRYNECLEQSHDILSKIDSAKVGFEATSGRYAAFYAGHINQMRREYDEAEKYYLKTLEFARKIDATETGYYLYSLINLGVIEEKRGDKKKAKYWYKEAKKEAPRSHSAYKSAKQHLKEL